MGSCADSTTLSISSYKLNSYLKKKYDIDNANIYAKYGVLEASNSLYSKEYFAAIADAKHLNEYIQKLSKANPQSIKQKSIVKAEKLRSIFKTLQNQYKINHQDFTLYSNSHNLVKLDNIAKNIPLLKPITNSVVTSHFGMRKHPTKRKKCMHKGIDMVGPKKSQIYAAADGVVEKAEFSKSYGYFILIKHKYNFQTRYAHLSKITVKKGDLIALSQHIGYQGATGCTKREHLHFEVIHNNKCINPWNFIKYN